MACSLGAVIAGLIDAGERFGDVEPAELIELVRSSVHDMLTPLGTRSEPPPAAPART
jgi:hypothetical protein